MREALENDLRLILEGMLDMLNLVEQMMVHAKSALVEGQVRGLTAAQTLDQDVDALENRIESDCLRIIALHQPVARDLRLIALILKSLADIERMGDYCVHVAEDGVELAQDSPLKRYLNLARMLDRLIEMIDVLRQSVNGRNVVLAEKAQAMDDEVDELYEQIQRELVTYMLEDPRTISKALILMRAGRSLERIGDHIENVAERVRYWVTGQVA